MVPIGLILLFLTGVGPLLAWRKSTLGNLRSQFLWPVTAGLLVTAAVVGLGVPFWASGLCFGFRWRYTARCRGTVDETAGVRTSKGGA
jgi:cytochrome c-type biogenesis protein CcmF